MESDNARIAITVFPLPFADKPSFLQGLALLLSIGLLAVTSYQVTLSVNDYLSNPTVVTIKNSDSVTFPELVLCNNVPLSFTSAATGMGLFKQFLIQFLIFYTRVQGPPMASGPMDIEALVHTIGRDKFKQYLSIWPETLVFSCRFNDGTNCSGREFFEQVDHPTYLNCYRFLPNRRFTDVTFILFSESLIGSSDLSGLFLNEKAFPLSAITTDGSLEYDRSSGAVLFIKHPQYYMHPVFRVMVSTGQSSVVGFTEQHRLSINKAEDPCLDSPENASYHLFQQVVGGTNQSSSGYTLMWQNFTGLKQDCVLSAVADYLEATCGCRDPNSPIDSKRASVPNCRDVKQPNYTFTSACFNQVKNSLLRKASTSNCYSPCENRFYSTQVTGTKWPLESNIKAMVDQMIRPTLLQIESLYGRRMYGLRYIQQASDQLSDASVQINGSSNLSSGPGGASSVGDSTLSSLMTNFNSSVFDSVQLDTNSTRLSLLEKLSSVVAGNFVKVVVRADSDTVQSVLETYKYAFSNVMSEIGGLLGLYLGWSALTFIDLLQLLHLMSRFLAYRLASRGKAGQEKLEEEAEAVEVPTIAEDKRRVRVQTTAEKGEVRTAW